MKSRENLMSQNMWQRFLRLGTASAAIGANQLIGLDIGSRAIKLVQITQDREQHRLQRVGIKKIERGIVAEGVVREKSKLIALIKELVQECQVTLNRVAISLSGSSVMVRLIQVPIMTVDELHEHLEWESESESYIPYEIDDVYLDFQILPTSPESEKDSSKMTVLLVAAKKEIVNERIEILKQAGLHPCVLDVDGLALANMYAMTVVNRVNMCVMILNVGASGLNMTIMGAGGIPLFIRDAPVGGDRYVDVVKDRLNIFMRPSQVAELASCYFLEDMPAWRV